ncbi:probable sodium/metabolite cotransporter BASS1, chloroplastic isoform X2 [Prosopis cineraria]|uniref:probable sodium/metabolite cotransporter BASS1, chloroplastic isoform X2 n=1 Tax=Prosopis cineraria TaxID=364024 RepID=UPI00240EF108|nr:probable sodium/metabolite cotransporter BASS1, chloroplastic isoform X2 [Prosopis cineraria]
MLASIASSHHGKSLFKLQSDPNLVVSLRSSRTCSHLASIPPNNCSFKFTLQRKFHPQLVLNQSIRVPRTSLAPLSTIRKTYRLSYAPPLRCGISPNQYSSNGGRSFRDWVELVGEVLSTAFPLWVTIGCVLGLVKPSSFDWVTPKLSILGLTTIMLGMGMTLTFDDLRGALAMPKEVLSGFVLQYSVMPISGFLVSKLLNLPSPYAAGLILVGCCPGGTASNIVTYLARGNVALSVLMTAASTFASVVMTPFLTAKLAGKYVAVNAADLLVSTLQVVLLPVLAGAFLNQFFQPFVKFFNPLMPPVAVATVAILCGNAIAQSSSAILMSGGQVILASCLLHASGFFFGYILARMLGIDVSSSRTISIEVGMQNSVLGLVLATKHFGDPLTTVPCAVSSVAHSIFGSALAGIWRRSAPSE